MIIKA